jgi:hypothetical protein
MTLTAEVSGLPPECARGHHCGIRSSAEGGRAWQAHCACPECRCPVRAEPLGAPNSGPDRVGVPMCSPEYARRQREALA